MVDKEKLDKLRELAQDQQMWDIITCERGPDWPSERPDMTDQEQAAAYRARRDRKYKTVEVIRGASVGQVGGARVRTADHVILPPQEHWDHFDKHVARAAAALGLKVVIEGAEKAVRAKKLLGAKEVPVEVLDAPAPTITVPASYLAVSKIPLGIYKVGIDLDTMTPGFKTAIDVCCLEKGYLIYLINGVAVPENLKREDQVILSIHHLGTKAQAYRWEVDDYTGWVSLGMVPINKVYYHGSAVKEFETV